MTTVAKLQEDEGRALEPLDDERSKTPFAYDGNVLGTLREDQVPRFFGALTDSDKLPTETVKLDELTAMQNRVDTAKVTSMAEKGIEGGKLPVVIKHNGKLWIADGHHRLTALWLRGEETAQVRFKDLEPVTNTMKERAMRINVAGKIAKVDSDMRVVWGWASVYEEKGEPVVDAHGDVIEEGDILKAAHTFVADVRAGKVMHGGRRIGTVVESLVLSRELQKALGIDLDKAGWFIGMKIEDPEVWEKVRDGTYAAFSFAGMARREEMETTNG